MLKGTFADAYLIYNPANFTSGLYQPHIFNMKLSWCARNPVHVIINILQLSPHYSQDINGDVNTGVTCFTPCL